jgi:transposase
VHTVSAERSGIRAIAAFAWHRSNELSRNLERIPGGQRAGRIADTSGFDTGRQVSAWLGRVSRQCSSGGKSTLLGVSKR